MRESARLQSRLLLYGAGWKDLSAALWRSPDLPRLYPEVMKVSYQVIRASTALLESARDEALKRSPADPVSAGLAPYLARHVEEERGHDAWLLEDLAALGIPPSEAEAGIASPHVAGMVGAQHYWIRHEHPCAILGYIAVLEGEPPDEAFFLEAAGRSGLPADAFRTLRYHARVDRAHWQDLLDLVDGLPLGPRERALMGLSVLHTCHGMAEATRAVLEGHAMAERS